MKYKIGDKVIDYNNRQLTIRDILSHPLSFSHAKEKVYYVYEIPNWFEERWLQYDPQWIREQKLNELGI